MKIAMNSKNIIEELVTVTVAKISEKRSLPEIIADVKKHYLLALSDDEMPVICPLDLSTPKAERNPCQGTENLEIFNGTIAPLDLSNYNNEQYPNHGFASYNEEKCLSNPLKAGNKGNPPKDRGAPEVEVITLDFDDDVITSQSPSGQTNILEKPDPTLISPAIETGRVITTEFDVIKTETAANFDTIKVEHSYSLSPQIPHEINNRQSDRAPTVEYCDSVNSSSCIRVQQSISFRRKSRLRNSREASKSQQPGTSFYRTKVYLCNVCGKSFSSRRSRNSHIGSHTKKTAHECDVCFIKHFYYRNKQRKNSSNCMVHCSTCRSIYSSEQN